MPNKLKNIFSNRMFELGGNLYFRDEKAKTAFLNALRIVEDEGKPVRVEGISSISTSAKDGGMAYPLMVEREVSDVDVQPSFDIVPITLNTPYGEKTVEFQRLITKSGVVLKSNQNDVIYFEFIFSKDGHKATFTYRMQTQYATSTGEVLESCSLAIELLERSFEPNESQNLAENNDSLQMIKESFRTTYSFWKKMNLIESKLGISFDPSKLGNINDDVRDVEELYVLLVEEKAIRLDGKLTSTESTGITFMPNAKTPDIGHPIELTFTGESKCSICGQDIVIYTANLLSNAIIKEIIKNDDGTIRVLYGDTDSKPMYISYRGFKTIEEADIEYKLIMSKEGLKEIYSGALTLAELITEMNYYRQ